MARSHLVGSANDHWNTPPEFLDLVRLVAPGGVIDLDPCSNPGSLVGARRSVGLTVPLDDAGPPPWPALPGYEVGDGLAIPWEGFTFWNPPYSRIGPWADKAVADRARCESLGLVIPSVAGWFHRLMAVDTTACALNGRLSFLVDGVPKTGNTRGSVVYLVSSEPETRARFREVFGPLGTLFRKI